MDIYIIRHGETEWNAEKRIQGRSDVPLNEKGRELARVTGEALKDIPFTRAFSSPLQRARETAELVLKGRDIPVILDSRITEMSFGVFEGENFTTENLKLQESGFMNFFTAPELFCPPEGGEDFRQVCDRTTAFLTELAAREEWSEETILLSSHGVAIKGLLSSVYPTADMKDFWHGGVHKNCAVSLVRAGKGKITLVEDGRIYY